MRGDFLACRWVLPAPLATELVHRHEVWIAKLQARVIKGTGSFISARVCFIFPGLR